MRRGYPTPELETRGVPAVSSRPDPGKEIGVILFINTSLDGRKQVGERYDPPEERMLR